MYILLIYTYAVYKNPIKSRVDLFVSTPSLSEIGLS